MYLILKSINNEITEVSRVETLVEAIDITNEKVKVFFLETFDLDEVECDRESVIENGDVILAEECDHNVIFKTINAGIAIIEIL